MTPCTRGIWGIRSCGDGRPDSGSQGLGERHGVCCVERVSQRWEMVEIAQEWEEASG